MTRLEGEAGLQWFSRGLTSSSQLLTSSAVSDWTGRAAARWIYTRSANDDTWHILRKQESVTGAYRTERLFDTGQILVRYCPENGAAQGFPYHQRT
ncbi:MAG: hypothetical protein KDA58_15825, partial [Planctomycetaceae bacterium]|nr:hypothetical protein [Planctomycetaceae bacterium]